MPWLLAAFIPGLLILVTLGLARIEAGLRLPGGQPPSDPPAGPEGAVATRPSGRHQTDETAATETTPLDWDRAADCLRIVPGVVGILPPLLPHHAPAQEPPVRRFAHRRANPEFRQTSRAGSV